MKLTVGLVRFAIARQNVGIIVLLVREAGTLAVEQTFVRLRPLVARDEQILAAESTVSYVSHCDSQTLEHESFLWLSIAQ